MNQENSRNMDGGECPACDYQLTKEDLYQDTGCGCESCFDAAQNGECLNCKDN